MGLLLLGLGHHGGKSLSGGGSGLDFAGFMVQRDSSYTVNVDNTTSVSFENIIYEQPAGSSFFSSGVDDTIVTIPTGYGGVWAISFTGGDPGGQDGGAGWYVYLMINGIAYAPATVYLSNGRGWFNGAATLELSAGDTVAVWVRQSAAGALVYNKKVKATLSGALLRGV